MNELQELLMKENELMNKFGIEIGGMSPNERFDVEKIKERLMVLNQIEIVSSEMNKCMQDAANRNLSIEEKESIDKYLEECKVWIGNKKSFLTGNQVTETKTEYNVENDAQMYLDSNNENDKLNLPKYSSSEIDEMIEKRNSLETELGINHEDVVSDSARNGHKEDVYMLKYDILRLETMKMYRENGNVLEENQLAGTYTYYNDSYFADVEISKGNFTEEELEYLSNKTMNNLDIDKRKGDSNGGRGAENIVSNEYEGNYDDIEF